MNNNKINLKALMAPCFAQVVVEKCLVFVICKFQKHHTEIFLYVHCTVARNFNSIIHDMQYKVKDVLFKIRCLEYFCLLIFMHSCCWLLCMSAKSLRNRAENNRKPYKHHFSRSARAGMQVWVTVKADTRPFN